MLGPCGDTPAVINPQYHGDNTDTPQRSKQARWAIMSVMLEAMYYRGVTAAMTTEPCAVKSSNQVITTSQKTFFPTCKGRLDPVICHSHFYANLGIIIKGLPMQAVIGKWVSKASDPGSCDS